MLSLTKKTDYALIALGYLAERPDQTICAREIAGAFEMPAALVMNILKTLHHHGWLDSTRGTKGGYRITTDLKSASVHDLIAILEGEIRLAECVRLDGDCPDPRCKISRSCPIQAPIRALHCKLVKFLKDVKLADVLLNGRCIQASPEPMVAASAVGAGA